MLLLILILVLVAIVANFVAWSLVISAMFNGIWKALAIVGAALTLGLLALLCLAVVHGIDLKYKFKEPRSPASQTLPKPAAKPIPWKNLEEWNV